MATTGRALARAGYPVALLARGAHLAAIRARGLEVRTPEGPFSVRVEAADDPAALGAADLAIVAVKTYSLDEVLPAARLLAGGAPPCSAPERRRSRGPTHRGGVPRRTSSAGSPRSASRKSARGRRREEEPVSERRGGGALRRHVGAGAEDRGGVPRRGGPGRARPRTSPPTSGGKFAFIAPMAAACGSARAPIGPVRDAPYGKLLLQRAVGEVLAVARVRGYGSPRTRSGRSSRSWTGSAEP